MQSDHLFRFCHQNSANLGFHHANVRGLQVNMLVLQDCRSKRKCSYESWSAICLLAILSRLILSLLISGLKTAKKREKCLLQLNRNLHIFTYRILLSACLRKDVVTDRCLKSRLISVITNIQLQQPVCFPLWVFFFWCVCVLFINVPNSFKQLLSSVCKINAEARVKILACVLLCTPILWDTSAANPTPPSLKLWSL